VLPTHLMRNVKESHKIDLAYLYYLPFCSVFTSKDNFHAEITWYTTQSRWTKASRSVSDTLDFNPDDPQCGAR
jgi:hypothetical protein